MIPTRSRQCTYKKQYDSQTEAARSAWRLMQTERPGPLRPYKCPWCGYWHIGHYKPELDKVTK